MKESFESKVRVQELESKFTYPEKNVLESFSKLFWLLGWVTDKPRRTVETRRPKPERPLAVRRERAKLLDRFKQAETREEKKRILEEARERDEALERFMEQKEVTVTRDDIGEAMARYVDMQAPLEADPKPPVVFIPGLSNDLACIDTVAQELNLRGRRVIAFGYPSASQGRVSEEFAKATKELPGFEAHSRFYGSAIKEVLHDEPFELWGFSTGAPIAGEMLINEDISSEQVERLVLLNPTSSVKMSALQLWNGLVSEVRHIVEKNFASYGLILEAKEPKDTTEEKKNKQRVFSVLLDRIREPFTKWKELRAKKGGEILVVSSTEDKVTRSGEYFNEKNMGTRMTTLQVKGGHMSPGIDTARVLDAIEDATSKKL